MAKNDDIKQQKFLALADEYKGIIAKVCSVYASTENPFSDLYQEVMITLWTGMDTYRGDAKVSTWIYRVALNTCISMSRCNHRRHTFDDIDAVLNVPEIIDDKAERVKQLYRLIARLNEIDRALVMLWLDERSYEEISVIMGISKANVATRMFRVRKELSSLAKTTEL